VPSKQRTAGSSGTAKGEAVDPADLQVRVDDLKKTRPDAGEETRNPFQFQPKAPPPPPPPPPGPRGGGRSGQEPPEVPQGPPTPPPPPAIPLKFIGIVEPKPGDRIAAFSDCLTHTFRGREGDAIDGRYRLVKIGVESVTMEYLDGRGRTSIRLTGLECVK